MDFSTKYYYGVEVNFFVTGLSKKVLVFSKKYINISLTRCDYFGKIPMKKRFFCSLFCSSNFFSNFFKLSYLWGLETLIFRLSLRNIFSKYHIIFFK